MTRQLHRAPGRSWLLACVLLTSLLFGQLGFGPGLLTALAGSADTCGNTTCPCEEAADEGGEAHHDHDHDEGSCPDDSSGEPCPPGCDDCTCCSSAVVAVTASLALCPESPPGGGLLTPPPYDPATGVTPRIFRPPKPSLV